MEEKLELVEARLERLRNYAAGELEPQLGIKPTTPCLIISGREARNILRRAVVKEYLGERPPKALVCHRCDDHRCIKPDHLFWGTHKDNSRDCVLKDRTGRRSYAEKLQRLEERIEKLRLMIEQRGAPKLSWLDKVKSMLQQKKDN